MGAQTDISTFMPLTIKPPQRPSTTSDSPVDPLTSSSRHTPVADDVNSTRSSSPVPPPASPLTPVVRPAVLSQPAFDPATTSLDTKRAQQSYGHPTRPSIQYPPIQFIDQPPSLPFSGDDATDAIALRAAISSLQLQKKKAQDDIRALQSVKRQAIERPDEFYRHVLRGESIQGRGRYTMKAVDATEDEDEDEEDLSVDANTTTGIAKAANPADLSALQHLRPDEVPDSQPSPGLLSSFGSAPASQPSPAPQSRVRQEASFPPIPQPQDVVRCPPINWAKYHIAGEPLERMHRQQQARPDNGMGVGGYRSNRDSVVSAPYDPFRDRMSSGSAEADFVGQVVEDGRKDSGASAAEHLVQHSRRASKFAH